MLNKVKHLEGKGILRCAQNDPCSPKAGFTRRGFVDRRFSAGHHAEASGHHAEASGHHAEASGHLAEASGHLAGTFGRIA
ncbi:MAG: hypothetical protein WBO48_17265 [Candidatus Promineifilaceae bacterium]